MEIQYISEHLIPGQLGKLFVVCAFVFAIFSTFSYFRAIKEGMGAWTNLGRLFFRLHSLSVAGIALCLFYIIFNHYFEYNYAWQHSSSDLPLRYILSCFWEGQEGSFLLWIFWHAVLGNILTISAKTWENSVMTVFSSVQVVLTSMLLGIYIFEIKIGSNPFMLLRDNPDMMNIPIFQNPDYTKLIEGNGLNPLLQNYWMTIHPPTLFLGFASTLIPFSYAMAALWEKRHIEWLKVVLPWSFFGVLILGTGVLMGGAWAYEALSFGGFWAWDPVENASLVPWLFLVGASHLMLLNKHKNDQPTSLFSTYLITIFTFLLILYSTYLTRSGILGTSSVHSFADGLPGQLIFFLVFYVLASLALIIYRYKSIPGTREEEHFLSRDFWMLIASIVFVISAFQITFTTSIPVINAIFGTNMAPPTDAIGHFNSWQIPFTIIVTLIMAFGQFLNYRSTAIGLFLKRIILSSVLAVVLTAITGFGLEIKSPILLLLLFTSLLAVLANIDYFIRILNGKVKNGGASIAHAGFGLIVLGSLLSAGLQKVISTNTSGIDIRMKGEETDANLENILLYKNDTLIMGPFLVSYTGREKDGINIRYEVTYTDRFNPEKESFSLYPRIQLNKNMGNVPEPDTKHWLTADLFTHVTYVNEQDLEENPEKNYQPTDTFKIKKGDTAIVAPYVVTLKGLSNDLKQMDYEFKSGDIAIKATLEVNDLHHNLTTFEPLLVIRENQLYFVPDENEKLGMIFSLIYVDPDSGTLTIAAEKDQNKKEDFIIMKAVIFPYINVLWTGCIIMILGTGLAIYHRVKRNKS